MALYVHVPFCRRKCPYCGFYSEPRERQDVGRLVEAMGRELERYGRGCRARTIYIGGGSPSSLRREELIGLIGAITRRVGTGEEFTVEMNPGQMDAALLRALRDVGVNRLSVGGQSFHDTELAVLGRPYGADEIYAGVRQAREAGFENINLDLIFAIPGSSVASWRRNLEMAAALGVAHIAAYTLSFEPGTPFYERRRRGELEGVEEETDRAMYEACIDVLGEAGWEHYEISNFARKGYRCRHNLVYWSNGEYLGIGPGASSYWAGRRRKTMEDVGKYVEGMEKGSEVAVEVEESSREEAAGTTAVLMLRRIEGINAAEYRERTGFEVGELFAEPIERYQRQGLLELDGGNIRLTRSGLPIADSILADFASL